MECSITANSLLVSIDTTQPKQMYNNKKHEKG
jgi:hypothetical protein